MSGTVVVGFTGTQRGMTDPQSDAFANLIADLRPSGFRHGCCIGADHDAHFLVRLLLRSCVIVGHPPLDESKMSVAARDDCDRLEPAKAYLVRNRDIVAESGILVAAPSSPVEQPRGSGTWATVRYGRQARLPLWFVYPDGSVEMPVRL